MRIMTKKKERDIQVLFVCMMLLTLCMPKPVFAASLTDLFETEAFHGSWEIFTKVNFIGQLLQTIISFCSLIGLFMTVVRIILNMVYLSNKNLWNRVHDIKAEGKGAKFFGMGNISKSIFSANYGTGLDAFVAFFMSLLFDVKAYSDYSDEGDFKYNFEDKDTITMYILKSALPVIMTVFFFTMGFNGTLWKAYGNVVNGMGMAAEAFVEERLSVIVNRALNSGSNPSFGYSADGTEYGAFKQSVAKTMYNNVISHMTDLSSDSKLKVGAAVDSWIGSNIDCLAYSALGLLDETTQKYVDSYLDPGNDKVTSLNNKTQESLAAIKLTDQQARNLEYSVVVNKTASYPNACTVDASELGLSADSGLYLHVFVTKKANSDETKYFEVKQEEESKSKSGTSDSKKPSQSLK